MIPLLLALWLGPQDKTAEKCAVSGTVVDLATQEPLAKVELTLEGFPGLKPATISDDQGRFSLVDLDPGDYHLYGKRTGYIETAYGAKTANTSGAVIHLIAGQSLADLALRLIPGGVISGTVRDSDGEPLEEAHLVLARRTYESGELRIEAFDSTDTDDLGQYRFRKLSPGKYFVTAEKHPIDENNADHSRPSSGMRYESVTTLYPGVADFAAAIPIEVTVGARVSGADIKLLRKPAFRVSGRVISTEAVGGQELALFPAGVPESMRDLYLKTWVRSDDGGFVFDRVPVGGYVLETRGGLPGSMRIEVGEKNIENIRLLPGAGGAIKGHIVIEPDGKGINGSILWTNDGRNGPRVRIGEDGSFFTEKLKPAQYRPYIYSVDISHLYIKKIREGGREVPTAKVEAAAGTVTQVEVILGQDGARLTGTVRGKDGEMVPSATVVLVPDGQLQGRVDLYRTASTDQFGAFRAENIAPGAYKILAWSEIASDQWFDPDFMSPYLRSALAWEAKPNSVSSLVVDVAAGIR